jgi:hypothetical protein
MNVKQRRRALRPNGMGYDLAPLSTARDADRKRGLDALPTPPR